MDNKLADSINKICMVTVKVIGMLLILYLFLLSLFSTSVRSVRNYGTAENPQWGRYTYFLQDNPIVNIAWIALVAVILFLTVTYSAARKADKGIKTRHNDNSRKKCRGLATLISPEVICGFYFVIVLLYILNTRLLPKSDPAGLLRIAEEILNQDFHEFEKEGYMYRYPYQSGFVFLCIGAVRFFGTEAYLVLQIVNALSLTMFFYLLGKLEELWWGYTKTQTIFFILAGMICAIPLFLYVTFIYGNLPGMALALLAVYLLELFLKKRKITDLLGSSFCIAAAITLKSNCLIFLVAVLIILIWDILKGKEKKSSLLAIICILTCYIVINQGTLSCMEKITGKELSGGIPKTALIAMGLEEGMAGPGTENGSSNRIYEENGYDSKAADIAAREKIIASMKRFVKEPASLVSFFARKMALQCNEPTFQAFSVSGGRESGITIPKWLNSLIAGKGSLHLAKIMNRIHTVILFGICVYIFFMDVKKKNLDEFVFLITFIGAFIFQMFYEAKSQYMLIFFFVMLPYAARGYCILTEKPGNQEKKSITVEFIKYNKVRAGIGMATVCLAVVLGISTGLFAHTICLQSSDELLREYNEVIAVRENPNG